LWGGIMRLMWATALTVTMGSLVACPESTTTTTTPVTPTAIESGKAVAQLTVTGLPDPIIYDVPPALAAEQS
jgi:hypothetical protein